MHTLVKFTDHAESFMNGCLYMNTLDYFWKNGFQEQKDVCEGVIGSIPPEQVTGFEQDFISTQGHDLQFQAVGYSYCNVFCMSIIDFLPNTNSFPKMQAVYPPNMNEFGKKAVIIDDENEFLRRINLAAKNFHYLCGRVNYHPPILNGNVHPINRSVTLRTHEAYDFSKDIAKARKFDAFDKSLKYRAQNEWRLCLYRGVKSIDPFPFEIGSIKDIAHIIDTKDFIACIPRLFDNPKVLNSVETYYGNTNRRNLRNMFYELGEYKAWMLSTIG